MKPKSRVIFSLERKKERKKINGFEFINLRKG